MAARLTPAKARAVTDLTDLQPTPITLANGVILNYVRAGQGPVLIFIHGAMGDWRSWGPQWRAFTRHFDCISYSRRYSHPNPNRMPSPDHSALVDAEDLGLFLDALGIEKAILVGSSYGGFTALALAVAAPARVAALVAVEPPMMRYAEMEPEGAIVAARFRAETVVPAREAFARGDDAEGARTLTRGIGGKRPADAAPPPNTVMAARLQNMLAARMLALSSDEFPLLHPDALAALPMPILLMSGAQTAPVHAAIFRALRARMPNAQVVIVPGSGHSVSREMPDAFNAVVAGFLDAVSAPL